MTEGSQEQPWKPIETDEMREIRMRRILGETLPALLVYITREAKEMEMMFGEGSVGESSFAETAEFLQNLDQQEVENRIYREWIKGDDTLLISILAVVAVRAHFSIKDLESRLAKIKGEVGVRDRDETAAEFLDRMKGARSEVEGTLSMLLEKSRVFKIEYGHEEFQKFLEEQNRLREDLRKQGLRSEIVGDEQLFFPASVGAEFSGRRSRATPRDYRAYVKRWPIPSGT